jgi:hypothetical protein
MEIMGKKVQLLAIASLFFSAYGICQKADSSLIKINLPLQLPAVVINGDTTAIIYMDEITVIGNRIFRNYNEAVRYYTLEQNVKTVYPFAVLAEATFEQCEATIKNMSSEADKKEYIKTTEKQLMKQYSDEMKNLTVTQGKILIKLIDRQTGKTSYEMVKELRGSFSAFMWQTVACLFGNNLKSTYDEAGEDKDIENIIHLIEIGAI